MLVLLTTINIPADLLVHAEVNTLYSTEFMLDYDPNASAWVIDRFGTTGDNIKLRFGNVPGRSITFDVSNSWFEFGSNINLKQNQIKNVALDNLPAAPTSPVNGQIYYNTTDKQTYVWNGTQWSNLTTTGHTQNTDSGTTSNTFTLDQDNSGGDTMVAFGITAGPYLRWDITNSRFVLNSNLRVEGNEAIVGQSFIANDHNATGSNGIINLGRLGNVWQKISFNAVTGSFETSAPLTVGGSLMANGNTFTLDADNTGVPQNVSIIAEQGTGNDGILRYNATLKRWELSNDGGAFIALENGYTTLFAQNAASTTACPTGGYVFTSGLDANRNSTLDSSEVANTATVCNGTGGSSGNGNTNSGGGNTLAGVCIVTRTASYSNSAQYSVALTGMLSYTDNNLELTLANGTHVNTIGNNNGGSSSWTNPSYILSILGSAQNLMLYLNYNGTPPAGQTPYVTSAKITKFGNTLNCTVVNL